MAKLEGRVKLSAEAVIVLDEEEMAALEALASYGDEAFLRVFYANLGESYLKPHEAGLKRFLASCRSFAHIVERADLSRQVFNGTKVAKDPPKERVR